MSAEGLHGLIGRRVVDDEGRHLGEIVGITHHWDGGASALVSGGRWPWSDGLHVSLGNALLIDDDVHLRGAHAPVPALSGHLHR
jgi:hypothetical protein